MYFVFGIQHNSWYFPHISYELHLTRQELLTPIVFYQFNLYVIIVYLYIKYVAQIERKPKIDEHTLFEICNTN